MSLAWRLSSAKIKLHANLSRIRKEDFVFLSGSFLEPRDLIRYFRMFSKECPLKVQIWPLDWLFQHFYEEGFPFLKSCVTESRGGRYRRLR